MIAALILLIPLLILSFWIYFKYSPKELNLAQRHVFDFGVILAAILLSLAFALNTYSNMSIGPDRAWWPIISILGIMGILIICLVVGALISYIIFNFISKRRK